MALQSMKTNHQDHSQHLTTKAQGESLYCGERRNALLSASLAAFVAILGNSGLAFGEMPLPHRADNQGWELVPTLSDEFNESVLDEKKWDTEVASWGVWSWDKSNAFLKDGYLHIRMVYAPHKSVSKEQDMHKRKVSWMNQDPNQDLFYKSGIAIARDKITYGYFEARIKGASKFPGVSPAFWMCGIHKTAHGEEYCEVDFMELQQKELKKVDCNLHAYRYIDGAMTWIRKPRNHWVAPWDPREDYHIYACETTPEKITWFVDGQQIAQADNLHWDLPMSPMFSMGLRQPLRIHAGSDGEGKITYPNPETSTPEGFPTEMTVDYIRVWKRAEKENASPQAPTEAP